MIKGIENAIYNRTSLLVGSDVMNALSEARVLIFGVGGVGSWCAEGLLRSGVKHLTLVDSDRVCVTNVNRQLMATPTTVGQVKVEALKERLLEINPKAEIEAVQKIYSSDTSEDFALEEYDYIIDAIDSLKDKADLILKATATKAVFFSSMGAACKIDPRGVKVAEFWDVRGCPLGAAIRKKFRKNKTLPGHKFLCVYDEEVLENKGKNSACGTEKCMCPKSEGGPGDPSLLNHEWCSQKARINGTLAHITAIFGMTLSGLVIEDIYRKALSS
ncbi:MAG: tRNA threonylcarbamoyladenosine dehydratase [Bacteroidales bacterium]|nr:tRNA threonylcarbamoyladenosine dehydratase [Bacteroidales bacterium]